MKKILALLLSAAMLVSLLSVGALAADALPAGGPGGPGGGMPGASAASVTSASEFSDYASLTQADAVATLVKIGLVNGISQSNGTCAFEPKASLTRGQMAKLITAAAELAQEPAKTVQSSSGMSDMTGHWAAAYVTKGVSWGLIDGVGGGIFDPDGTITGAQTAKLLLASMGVTGLTGDGWADTVAAKAEEAGLLSGLKLDLSAAIDREDAARMIYNALSASDGVSLLPHLLVIAQSQKLASFTVDTNEVVTAPDGKELTMTVGGVETALDPGTYLGVTLSLTDSYSGIVSGYSSAYDYRAALYVDSTGVVASRSATAALQNATFNSTGISGGTITSNGPLFNGIIVNGGTYTISGMTITLNGYGGNDFAGYGTGILVCGNAKVTLENCTITTKGVIRNAFTAADNAVLTVKNCTIETEGGTDAEEASVNEAVGGMTSVPWVLGLSGNCRATNAIGNATVTYEGCTFKSSSWGVLSTDDVDKVRMTATDCTIDLTGNSGYGSYSIGDCINTYKGCTFNVPNYALVVANEKAGGVFSDGTVVNSDRFGVMWHQNQGGLTTVDGATFHTDLATFLIKSCYPQISVSNSTLTSGTGVILQMMDSDDAGLSGTGYTVVDQSKAVKNTSFDVTVVHDTDVKVSLSDMTVNGSLYNGTTGTASESSGALIDGTGGQTSSSANANLVLSLDSTKLTGLITASYTTHTNVAVGQTITKNNREELGIVSNTPSAAVNNGVILTLKGNSVWTVTGTSYLTSLTVEGGSSIVGTVYVNGAAVTPAAGTTYTGTIVVTK